MLRTFIQVTALILTLEAAIFLSRGNIGLTAQMIAKLSSTHVGYSIEVVKSLAAQKADTWVGLVLILTAFGLQLWNALWPVRRVDFTVDKRGVALSLVMSVLVLAGAWFIAKCVTSSTVKEVEEILKRAG